MGKELTIAQLTFVDLYDSYTLSLSSDVIAVPCDAEGDALNTKTYTIDYQVRAGEEVIKSKCTAATLSTTINNVEVNYNTAGTISVKVNATARIPEDSGINITVVTDDSNEFTFNRFISFMNIKKGQDGRGYSSRVDQYALTVNTTPPDDDDWENTFSSPTKDEPYLWNREIIYYDTYTNGVQDRDTTQARIISIYGKDGNPGKGIKFITEYYTASNSAESPGEIQAMDNGTVSVSQGVKSDGVSNVTIDASTGYYTIDMNKQPSSYSVVKLTFNVTQITDIVIKCINNGESTYDYMMVSHISTNDSEFCFSDGFNTNESKNTFYSFSGSDKHSENPVDVIFQNVATGTHYVYIKVRKDGSVDNADTYKFKCYESVADWTTSDPDNYGPDYPYLWNYIEFTYTDDTTSTTPPHLSAHWGLDGTDAFTLKVAPDKGDVFKEGIEKIRLSLEAYEGENKINVPVPYAWKYYSFKQDVWTTLSSGTANIEDIFLDVYISDSYAYSMFKCEIYYKNTWFSDYETLKEDVHDIYYAETRVLADGTLADGNCAIVCVQLYKNNKEIDGLPTETIHYIENLYVSSNNTAGRFYTKQLGSSSNNYKFLPGSEGDIVYLLTYSTMQYFEYAPFDDSTEYVYDGTQLYESHGNNIENTYASKTTNGNTYRLTLAQYKSGYWYPYKPYDAYEYCYVNNFSETLSNITFGNSKVFVIDKRKLSSVQDMTIGIYEKVYDDRARFPYYVPFLEQSNNITVYDMWKIQPYHLGDDNRVFSMPCSALQAVKTKYTEESFKRREDGVYIEQVVTEWNSVTGATESRVPFFVKIASEEIGFYSSEDKETPMVHIGNSSTNVRNSVLDGSTIVNDQARFNDDVILTQTATSTTGFRWTFDDDGSLSLVTINL